MASGAVFRSEPTTMAVMTAAHQTAMETVAVVERFGMTGMAVLGTGPSRSPA